MNPEEIVARLLYRDGLMLVIDKPAGFAVHKGPKGGESLEDFFHQIIWDEFPFPNKVGSLLSELGRLVNFSSQGFAEREVF